jgi:hypothetical protein
MGYRCVRGRGRRYVSVVFTPMATVADFCVGHMYQLRGSDLPSGLSLLYLLCYLFLLSLSQLLV